MSDIFNFVPKSELDANKNLENFINDCKSKLTVFGENLNWNAWKWPKVAHFTKLGTTSQGCRDEDQFDSEFIDFAKAYLRYQQGHKPTETKNELKALRTVEQALLQLSKNAAIKNLTIAALDEAVQLTRLHYSGGAAYHCGKELERLAQFITKNKLIASDLGTWKSPIPRKKDEIQTGAIAKARRDKKLPSDEALGALAEIFANNPVELKDIFVSSTFAMLMCAPSRITEVLQLPVDCEVEEMDSKGMLRYGWRFHAGKGFGADIKWIPTEMVGIAKEAVKRITILTNESRQLAKWIESNSNKFYRHAQCPEVADNESLTAMQACKALGLVEHIEKHAKCNLLTRFGKSNKVYTLNQLWHYALSRQPEGLPWLSKERKIKYSNALFCMQLNMFHSVKNTSPIILWTPDVNVFNNDLSARVSLKSEAHKSIFDRYGYKTVDGGQIKLTSHQARHLLNTMAQRGGLSQFEIAKWSGRADPNQNRTYNHMSEYEIVLKVEQLDTSLSLFGPSGVVDKNFPITIQEFNTLEKGAVHVTEFGVCVHDFTMAPCDKYRDCLNCSEQVCIKGNSEKFVRIKKRFEEVKSHFESAEKALQEGHSGADKWYEYHKNTLEHLRQLIFILENPDIEKGAQIKLRNDKAFSPLRRAIDSKLSVANKTDDEDDHILQNITKLLKGEIG